MMRAKNNKIQYLVLVSTMIAFVLSSCDEGSGYGHSSNQSNTLPYDNRITYGSSPQNQNVDFNELMRQMERSNASYSIRTTRQSGSFTPDDAYDEGYDNGYEQGRYDGENGRSHGYGYDESNSYYNHYETMYEDGYSDGYDDGYSEGLDEYEEDNDDY